MSASEVTYSFRDAYPNVLEVGRTQLVKLEVYRDGALVAPTASGSTYTLYKPDNTKLVDAAAVTVSSSVAQHSISSSVLVTTLALGEGYREEWVLVLPDGTTRTIRREAALAKKALYPVVTDLDLDAEYPDMARYLGNTITSWQRFIDEAWKRIISRLIAEGTLPYLIMSPTAFRDHHRELANYLRFKWLFQKNGGTDSRLSELMKTHAENAKDEWGHINFVVDRDHDGVPDETERSGVGMVLHPNSAPHRRLRTSGRW